MPHLIESWKEAWKWGSARMLVVLAMAQFAYEYLQADQYLSSIVSQKQFHYAMAALAFLTLVSKLVRFDGQKS